MLLPYLNQGVVEAGCDEAGRGCLAGPVYASAVILPVDFDNELLNDSKQLTERQRYELRPIIQEQALAWAVGVCDNHEIDRYNILKCSIMAMHRAIRGLYSDEPVHGCVLRGGQLLKPQALVVDGNRFYAYEDLPHTTVVKGDGKLMSIAAASILAKTYRDDYMNQIAAEYPAYNWAVNKGYPTKDHRAAIAQHGPCPYHRMTFRLLPQEDLQFKLDL